MEAIRKAGAASVLAAVAVMLGSSAARATPSSHVWVNSTDVQKFGSLHLGIDNFVALEKEASPLSADFGLTTGVLPSESLQLEIGVDWWANAAAPLWLNAKLGTPEKGGRPAFAIGAYGIGVESDSRYDLAYLLTAKTLGKAGRVTLGGYHAFGAPELFGGTARSDIGGKRTGLIAAWDRPMTEIDDRLWLAADLQTGDNAFSAASVGASWKFADSASVLVGYNRMLGEGLPGTVYVALDADVSLLGGGRKKAEEDEAAKQEAEGAVAGQPATAPGTATVVSGKDGAAPEEAAPVRPAER